MKAKEIREFKYEELETKLRDLKSEFFNLRFQHATGQLANPMQLKQIKRDIARVKTIMSEMDRVK